MTRGSRLKVIEKIGSISGNGVVFTINIFRLAFWLSKNINIDYPTYKLLLRSNIF